MKKIKSYSYRINKNDFVNAGKVSSEIKKNLKKIGFTNKIIRKLAVISYEGEMNIIIHSEGGGIELEIYEDKITLNIRDIGPGIDDVELAMTEGYSTAPSEVRELGFGAGMGLPNINNCSDDFKITSSENGTKIESTIYLE
ncbi:MAG: anti-sigma regulatory factor [Tissierellales bacterium]|jgi:anti-sigma regulatory factor (Ser/Thr protein kinase)|nr:anti-sigma regulatory factor [Tissierellales bacterium]HCX03302.1 anti-sigma regulatory factor [Clostridiales bacterium]